MDLSFNSHNSLWPSKFWVSIAPLVDLLSRAWNAQSVRQRTWQWNHPQSNSTKSVVLQHHTKSSGEGRQTAESAWNLMAKHSGLAWQDDNEECNPVPKAMQNHLVDVAQLRRLLGGKSLAGTWTLEVQLNILQPWLAYPAWDSAKQLSNNWPAHLSRMQLPCRHPPLLPWKKFD